MAKDMKPPRPLAEIDPEKATTFLPRQGAPRSYKSQGLATLMPGLTRKLAGKRPTQIGDLQVAWPAVVGQDLARFTRPAKLSAGTLHLETALGAGPVIALKQETILARVSAHLGAGKVVRVRLHQVDMPLPDAAPLQKTASLTSQPLTPPRSSASAPQSVGAALARLKARLDAARPNSDAEQEDPS